MKKHIKLLTLGILLSNSLLFCAGGVAIAEEEQVHEAFENGHRTGAAIAILRYCFENPRDYVRAFNNRVTLDLPLMGGERLQLWEIDDIPGVTEYLQNFNEHPTEFFWLERVIDSSFKPIFDIIEEIEQLKTGQLLVSSSSNPQVQANARALQLAAGDDKLNEIYANSSQYIEVPVLGVVPKLQGTADRYFGGQMPAALQQYYTDLFQTWDALQRKYSSLKEQLKKAEQEFAQ